MKAATAYRPAIAVTWIAALASAFLGAAILYDASPGINWVLWVASAAAALIVARKLSGLEVDRPVLILLAWATLLASTAAFTANEFKHVLVFLSVGMLLGLAVIVTGTRAWSSLSFWLLPRVPVLAPLRVWTATVREAAIAPRAVSSTRAQPVLRGLLLTVPLVVILVALLRNADPTFAWAWSGIANILPDWISGRAVFFLVVLSLTLGANSIAARQREARLPVAFSWRATLGMTEQRMVLIAVVTVLWLFVVLQVSYLFRSPPAAVGSGVTFAEYARQGFAELSVAVTLVGAVILILHATRAKEPDTGGKLSLVNLELAALVALEIVLLSAFRRVVLYEEAYGFTTDRLFAQAYMIGVALVLVALGLEVWRGHVSIAFGRRAAVIALAILTLLLFWNYDAWIINRNIDRAIQSGKFDLSYARNLSPDGAPTLIARRREIGSIVGDSLELSLKCGTAKGDRRWFEWNRAANAADGALQGVQAVPCPFGKRLSWSRSAG
ncbi:MAG: DUF4173 domain-containing protein [Gemmatimonadota bacterium]|nr:DUF4173 domain-containing protein [Gemmatimonadota bacterium]